MNQADGEQGKSGSSGGAAGGRRGRIRRAGSSRFGWHSLRRIRRPLAAGVLLLVIFTRHQWWPPAFHQLAENELFAQRPTAALKWLDVAEVLGARRLDTALLRCQAARRDGDPLIIRRSLDELEARDAPARLQERELILFQAQSGEMAEAAPWLGRLLTDETGDNRDVCISYVIGFLRTQRYQEAGALVDALMKDVPEDPFPWYVRGRVFALQQQFPKAEADFRESMARNPDWLEPVISLAELLSDTHRQRDAIPLYERVVQSPPLKSRAIAGLSEALKATGDRERARQLLRQTLAEGVESPDLWISLGRSEFEDGHYKEAAEALEKGLKLRPWADDALFVLAQCRRQLGQTATADSAFARLEEFRAATAELKRLEDRISGPDPQIQDRLRTGELLLQYRDPQDGVVVLQGVLDLDPQSVTAHKLLARHFAAIQPPTESAARQQKYHEQQVQRLEGSEPQP
ncbi:MAG: tetratricopeptide repeat protein [Planctomycetota bacterium]